MGICLEILSARLLGYLGLAQGDGKFFEEKFKRRIDSWLISTKAR